MSKSITPSVTLSALRHLVAERSRLRERSMTVPALLRWLDVDEQLVEIWLRIGDARSALARGDTVRVENELHRMEAQLRHLVDVPEDRVSV